MTLQTASVLAFERNLDVSDAFFTQTNSTNTEQKPQTVIINVKSVRGTISNRLKKEDLNEAEQDPTKLDAEIEKPNLQKVDSASLNEDCDTLIVSFSCKVLPFDGKPNVCNSQAYQEKMMTVVEGYLNEHGVTELAKRYAINIANARWLWRNRVGAESVTVTVRCGEETLTFNAKDISLQDFDVQSDDLTTLASWIAQGLTDKKFVILYIKATVLVGYGQEVYPSQELILDTGNQKSKVLYQINGKASMHSQKISNAIRTIDNWYPCAQFPIAIEPYGAVTTLGIAFRQPKQKMDFYSLFDNWILNDKKPEVEQQHYVMGVLIRGGVFGESRKKEKKEK